jgi:hypothetical protein
LQHCSPAHLSRHEPVKYFYFHRSSSLKNIGFTCFAPSFFFGPQATKPAPQAFTGPGYRDG